MPNAETAAVVVDELVAVVDAAAAVGTAAAEEPPKLKAPEPSAEEATAPNPDVAPVLPKLRVFVAVTAAS